MRVQLLSIQKEHEELQRLVEHQKTELADVNSGVSAQHSAKIADLESRLRDKDKELAALQEQCSDRLQIKEDAEALTNQFTEKCKETEVLKEQCGCLRTENERKARAMDKLHKKYAEVLDKETQKETENSRQLKHFDEQRIAMEENKGSMKRMRAQMVEFRTKYEMNQQNMERVRKDNVRLERAVEDKDGLILSQRKKIKVCFLSKQHCTVLIGML